MTDEELKEAERYWREHLGMAEPRYCANQSWDNYLKGFAAACESKSAEIDSLKLSLGDCGNAMMAEGNKVLKLDQILEAERARSAKLIETLRQGVVDRPMEIFGHHWDRVVKAVAEYEAGK